MLVPVLWRMPPVLAADGGWYASYKRVDLPEHIAAHEEAQGRCVRDPSAPPAAASGILPP